MNIFIYSAYRIYIYSAYDTRSSCIDLCFTMKAISKEIEQERLRALCDVSAPEKSAREKREMAEEGMRALSRRMEVTEKSAEKVATSGSPAIIKSSESAWDAFGN